MQTLKEGEESNMISATHITGVLLTVMLLVMVSWLSGRNVKDERSFTTGGTAGSWMVCGAFLTTLAGGQSTVGTAQLAFSYGLSAWWFTLGAALGGVVLALFYAGPLRRSVCSTLLEIVRKQYGRKVETVGSLLFLLGIFISIVAQVLTSGAMIGSLFNMSMAWSLVVGAVLIMLFVLFGGIRSAGAGGIIKLFLLYCGSVATGIIVWHMAGGHSGMSEGLRSIYSSPTLLDINDLASAEEIHHRYGSIVSRGLMKDLGGALSIILGVVSTQTYAQCIWSGATTAKARRGALYCTFFIPIIGAACTLVGIYMRGHYVTADELAAMQRAGEALPAGIGVIKDSSQAFPSFIINHLPAWFGGLMLGTLLINILGCGSGLCLGGATILVRDVLVNAHTRLRKGKQPISQLLQTRLSIVALLALGVVVAQTFSGSFINDLGFLSLGLRAVAIIFPLSFALWLPSRFSSRAVLLSMPIGTIAMLLANFLSLPGGAVYYGLIISLLTILITSHKNRTIH